MGNGYASHDVSWGPGDRLLLYTDGLIEARDRRGRFLPIEDIAGCLDTPGIDESLQRLLEVVTGHAAGGRLADDLALVLLENVARDPGLTPRHPTA
jgi:serine phosphatase RsbU (regulator of sigma subunit)